MLELLIALAGVVVGATGAALQIRRDRRDVRQGRDAEHDRQARLDARLDAVVEAGREMQRDLQVIGDRLHCLELQVARLAGYIGQGRRAGD